MTEIFKAHVQKFIEIDEEEFSAVLPFFQISTIKKKENLLVEGEICKSNYFVLKGCLRKFFINEKGIEQTTDFAIEHWWITDNIAYEHKLPTQFNIQAVEDSTILTIDSSVQERLLIEHSIMERYFRFVYQRAYASSQMRIKYLYSYSKEEIYDSLCKNYPDFVQRIPQYLIASYLGFTPEYLSEIRKKRS
jgi:CRP-like cAMP-binding protein